MGWRWRGRRTRRRPSGRARWSATYGGLEARPLEMHAVAEGENVGKSLSTVLTHGVALMTMWRRR
jgi:hypothetical protein